MFLRPSFVIYIPMFIFLRPSFAFNISYIIFYYLTLEKPYAANSELPIRYIKDNPAEVDVLIDDARVSGYWTLIMLVPLAILWVLLSEVYLATIQLKRAKKVLRQFDELPKHF